MLDVHNSKAIATRRRVPMYSLLVANVISGIGNSFSMLAIPWFVLQTTGSAGRAGITGAVEVLPIVLAGVLGGTLVDRVGYRNASMLSDIASAVAVALIPLIYHTIGLPFWALLLLVFSGRLLVAPGTTARRSLVPELAEFGNMPLSRANGTYEAFNRLSTLLGPPLAGILIAIVSASNVLWIDAATFGISMVIVGLLIPAALTSSEPGTGEGLETSTSYFSQIRDGFRSMRRDNVIVALVVAILLTNLIESPTIIMVTVYARDILDSSVALGIIVGAFGGGAVAGAMLFGWLDYQIPRSWILPIAFATISLNFGVFLIEAPLPFLIGMIFLTGIAGGPANPLLDTVFQERIPARMRGRIFGLRSALMMSATPLGVVFGGFVIEVFGLHALLAGQMASMLLVVAWMLISPSLKQLGGPARS